MLCREQHCTIAIASTLSMLQQHADRIRERVSAYFITLSVRVSQRARSNRSL